MSNTKPAAHETVATVSLHRYLATVHVLAERERELLALKGPCSTCRLHYAHSGPCAPTTEEN